MLRELALCNASDLALAIDEHAACRRGPLVKCDNVLLHEQSFRYRYPRKKL